MFDDSPNAEEAGQDRDRWRSQYAEIAKLAGGLAHEIRNPLSTIGLNLDLLMEEIKETDTPRDRRMLQKLSVVKRQCELLDRILDDFLHFARVGELRVQPADLNRSVEEFIEFYQPQAVDHGIDIRRHLAANLPPVNLDVNLWRQVLMNLSKNAQQAMPNGGILEFLTYIRNDMVVLDVIDNGKGMNPETQSRIFEAFYSTKRDGSGLGLPTVRKVVEAHKGTVSCESEVGRGTRFSISLPATSPVEAD